MRIIAAELAPSPYVVNSDCCCPDASEIPCKTSQLPIDHWHAWIGDATIANAILDRILQHHHRFTPTGDSLRQPAVGADEFLNHPTDFH